MVQGSERASIRTARETVHCGGGEPRRILKYMHAYHTAQMVGSSCTRLTTSGLTHCWHLSSYWRFAFWWRLNNISKNAQIIFAKGIMPSQIWKQWFTDSMLLLFFKLIDPLSWDPLQIHDLDSCRKEFGEPTACFILCPTNLFPVVPLKSLWRLSIAQSVRFQTAASEQIKPWNHMMLL